MRSPLRKTLAVVAAAIVTPAVAACEPVEGGGGEAPNPLAKCRTGFQSPYRPRIAPGRLIKGETKTTCRQSPDTHKVTLYLQRRTPAGWEVRDQEVSTLVPDAEGFTLLVLVDCAPGTWRLRFEVIATAGTQTASPKENSDTLTIRSWEECGVPR